MAVPLHSNTQIHLKTPSLVVSFLWDSHTEGTACANAFFLEAKAALQFVISQPTVTGRLQLVTGLLPLECSFSPLLFFAIMF